MPTPLIDMQNVPAPSGNPSSGRTFLYVNSSNKLPYWKTDSGTVLRAFFNPSSVDADVVPDTANSRDLGSSAKPWRSLFLRGDLSMKDGYNIPFGNIGSVFSVQWSHSYIGIGFNTYNDPSGPQLKHLGPGASAQFLMFNPHQHRVEYYVHEPSSTSPGAGQNVVYTTPRWWVTRDGDMRVLRDAQIVRHLTVDGNTTLGNAHDDSTTINGTLNLQHYPFAAGTGPDLALSQNPVPINATIGGSYITGNKFIVPTGCDGWYRVHCEVEFVTSSNQGYGLLQILRNNTLVHGMTWENGANVVTPFLNPTSASCVLNCAQGDQISFAVGLSQTSGNKFRWYIERVR